MPARISITRRELLSGVAIVAAGAVVSAVPGSIFDRIVMRDGWILKESDLK